MIIAGILFLATRLMNQARVNQRFTHISLDREKARALALSGIEIAKSELETPFDREKVQQKKYRETDRFAQILFLINRWHEFVFDDDRDGFDGTVRLYISDESSKIPINALYNTDAKKENVLRKDNTIDAPQLLSLSKKLLPQRMKEVNITEAFTQLLKTYRGSVDDISQLFMQEKMRQFAPFLFMEKSENTSSEFSLHDLFTATGDTFALDPRFLTQSFKRMLGMKLLPQKEPERRELIRNIYESIAQQAPDAQAWDANFASFYGKKYQDIPDNITKLFTKESGRTLFSVVSYGTIGGITQRLFAIIKRTVTRSKNTEKVSYTIQKIYWL
jgi:hypothetical protein